MTTRKIHSASKVFWKDPHVLMVDFSDTGATEYSAVKRNASRNLKGTWGYSTLISSHDSEFKLALKAYFCFMYSEDVMQFRLSIGQAAKTVTMWPSLTFTIFEH